MRWMETIRVRLTETDRARIITDLSRQLFNLAPRNGLAEARLYSDAQIQTDLSINLCWNTPDVQVKGSPLGSQLATGLRGAGFINHTVWREEECK